MSCQSWLLESIMTPFLILGSRGMVVEIFLNMNVKWEKLLRQLEEELKCKMSWYDNYAIVKLDATSVCNMLYLEQINIY
jgi:hypothetical protein